MWYKSSVYKGLAPTSDKIYYVLSLVLDYNRQDSRTIDAKTASHEKNKESHLFTAISTPRPPYTRNYGRSRSNYF